jgi:hypothetical protein
MENSFLTHVKSEFASDRDPLDLVERDLILPAVVELGRPRRLVIGDELRGSSVPLFFK